MISSSIERDPFAQQFLQYVEKAVQDETAKIMDKYKKLMEADLEAAREKIVAQAGIQISHMVSIKESGNVIRVEIVKRSRDG